VACGTLTWAEDFEFVYERLSQALDEARRAGSRVAVGNISTDRAECGYRMGRLLEAEADAAAATDLAADVAGLQTIRTVSTANSVLIGIERGADLGALHAVAFDPSLDALQEFFTFTQVQWARGELLLLEGEYEQALEQLRACKRPDPTYGGENPAMVPWREAAAHALVQLGDHLSARELADEAVARARAFGAPRALGVALRAAALVQTGSARVDGLRASVRALESANSALELARARCDLGAALRAAGKRTEAQDVLGPAYELARALGATRLAERAAAELTAAGVKPRRELLGGVAALTPSERRVAELAAGGKTNREIAQALFVTEKTVETHLGHVYDKLGIRSRRKLQGALAAPVAA
jgi:DNA-binding CsgD family transcriptional regulator